MIHPISEGIWKIEGKTPGKRVGILGGVHGNERTGIAVVGALREALSSREIEIACGTLYLILGNLRAIAEDRRYLENGRDLNRMFDTGRLGQPPDGSYEDARAREIADVLRQVDISIDIHSTNKPSVPFLCCASTTNHEQIFRWFDADRVLADPRFILGGTPVTTDEYVDQIGGVGVCYETGWNQDEGRAGVVLESIKNILRDQGMIVDGVRPVPSLQHKKTYELVKAIIPSGESYTFAPGMGERSFQEIANGQIIGTSGDETIRADQDGVIVFPKLPEHWKLGGPMCYLAICRSE